jgi:CMP-N,N'-diacetyllegionaminic acid synthase
MSNVAIIPARSGSKRVAGKNIKKLCGKPLIAYSIEAGLQSKSIDRVIVSTDSEEIAKIATSCGAEVPFLRPKNLASDDTPDRPVFLHLIDWLKNEENYIFDNLVILRPTTPFKTANLIDEVLEEFGKDLKFSSIRTVTKVAGVFHPYWMYKKEEGFLKPFTSEGDISKYYQSQLLPECFRINGVVDVVRTETILNSNNFYGDEVGCYEIEEVQSLDIDTEFDFEMCEFVMKKK